MQIASDRSYGFTADAAELWAAIAAVERFPQWWPWLRRFEAQALERGDVWQCTVQPPLPYSLSFSVSLDDVAEGERVSATISGEIEGTATLTIEPADQGCRARLTSTLAPSSRFLQAIALVARPVVSLGHDWVLDTGARQFRQHLR